MESTAGRNNRPAFGRGFSWSRRLYFIYKTENNALTGGRSPMRIHQSISARVSKIGLALVLAFAGAWIAFVDEDSSS